MNNKQKKVLVWLSWWVDSAVSAYLLKKEGYDITAWFMINYLAPKWEYCPTKEDIKEAKKVAKFLDIPFFIFDYVKEYEKKVLNYMFEWYKKWITPNPDIMCNSEVKFKIFLEEALALWFDYIAMWHYARIKKEEGEKKEISHLLKWVDENKDQTYFLAWLSQEQLSKAIFPIWNLQKSEVRKIAEKIGLPNAKRKDSQGICFVWKVNMFDFLEKKIKPKKGLVKNTSWKILWEHKWVFYYTIWQRKWLDIWGQKEAIFIVKKDLEKNEIIVWTSEDLELFSDELIIKNINFLAPNTFDKKTKYWYKFSLKAKCKIRYRQKDQECIVFPIITENKKEENFKVKFTKKQRAIASWQICAIYLEDELIMSGVIV